MIFRKLTANDVEARVKSCDENGFVLLLYKNARCDMNILDETVGAENWQREHYECKGNLFCRVGIKTGEPMHITSEGLKGTPTEWVWKADCGTESNTEKEKGESSDSFKRACFNWGIGRELYTAPKTKIKGHTNKTNRNGKDVWVPEYYEFDVVDMEVSEELPRRITALTIIGKSMKGGYHEDEIFNWTDKITPPKQKPMIQEKPDKLHIDALIETAKAKGVTVDKLCKKYKVKDLSELTYTQYNQCASGLNNMADIGGA